MLCYLELIDALNMKSPKGAKELFVSLGYSDSDFDIFEEKRKTESEYYIGKQYE